MIELQELVDLVGDKYKGKAVAFINAIGKRRWEAIRKRGADAMWRVGTGGGAGGVKKDQVLMYSTKEKALTGGNEGDSIKKQTLKELLPNKKDRDAFKEVYPQYEDDTELYSVGESLKWTLGNSSRINLGTQPTTTKVANEWIDPTNAGYDFAQQINKALGIEGEESSAVESNFKTITDISKTTTKLMKENKFGPKTKQADITKSITKILGVDKTELKKYGVDYKTVQGMLKTKPTKEEIEKHGRKKATELAKARGMKQAQQTIERGLLLKTMESGLKSEDKAVRKSWRQTQACIVMRGAYDIDDSYDVLEDLSDTKTHRHKRNDTLKGELVPYIDDDSSAPSLTPTSFNVGNLNCSLAELGRPSVNILKSSLKGKKVVEGTISKEDLLSQLLETQQLLFSLLIKE